MIRLRMFKLGIDYDKNYGIDKRKGWTVIWDGHVLKCLEKHLIPALVGAFKANRQA